MSGLARLLRLRRYWDYYGHTRFTYDRPEDSRAPWPDDTFALWWMPSYLIRPRWLGRPPRGWWELQPEPDWRAGETGTPVPPIWLPRNTPSIMLAEHAARLLDCQFAGIEPAQMEIHYQTPAAEDGRSEPAYLVWRLVA